MSYISVTLKLVFYKLNCVLQIKVFCENIMYYVLCMTQVLCENRIQFLIPH